MTQNLNREVSAKSSIVACVQLSLFATLVVAAFAGCSRTHYRLRADREAAELVAEKNHDARWQINDFTPYADKRARHFDPNDPDHPPMPPDDPTSHAYMHRLDGKNHYKKWHKDGDTKSVESPCWRMLLPTYTEQTEDGKIKLDLTTSALLARLHSSEYQDNLEEVYLAALDVAFERFRFNCQYALGNDIAYSAVGNETAILGAIGPLGTTNSTSILENRASASVSRRFATGAEALIGFANSVVWQFSGTDTNFSTSLLNFSFLQPFLRGGGKVVALEQLTRAERSLLAALRSEAQYREEFYKNIVVGGTTTVSPNRIGGFQGGAGLSGFTGTGQGGFGGVGAGQNFGGTTGRGGVGQSGAGGGAGLAGGGEGNVGGFLGLVQQRQAIRNTESSLASQLITLELLEANFEAGLIDLVQVDEFRQNIETEKSSLLRSQVQLQDQVELYLISSLGLPPNLPVEIDDSVVRQFQFIDPTLSAIQNEASDLLRDFGKVPKAPTVNEIATLKAKLERLIRETRSEFTKVQREFADLKASQADLLKKMTSEDQKSEFIEGLRQTETGIDQMGKRITASEKSLKDITAQIAPETAKRSADLMVEETRSLSTMLQEVALLQARIRLERVNVKPIKLEEDAAVEIARVYRLDWMNRRAALVDQWRLIAFNANRLKSFLNLEVNGSLGTVGDSPLKFRGSTGNLSARLAFDAPVNRKSERNLYRESLIEYQRAKRSYTQYVDRISLTIRSRLRQIRRLEMNLEIQRRALGIAIRRVDQTIEAINEPSKPSQPGQAPAQLAPLLAQNLLRALADLRNTQDNFMSVWLNYESARMNLGFDIGLLRFDEQGQWIDEPLDEALMHVQGLCQDKNSAGQGEQYVDHLDAHCAYMASSKERPADPIDSLSAEVLQDEDIKVVKEELSKDVPPKSETMKKGSKARRGLLAGMFADSKPLPEQAAAEPAAKPNVSSMAATTSANQKNETIETVNEENGKMIPIARSSSNRDATSNDVQKRNLQDMKGSAASGKSESVWPAKPSDGIASGTGTTSATVESKKLNQTSMLGKARSMFSGPKTVEPTASEFAVNLRRIKKMQSEGKSAAEIQKLTGFDETSVNAYLKAANWAKDDVLIPMPAKEATVPMK